MENPILASMRWILNEQYKRVRNLEEENEKLKEFKEKREESMFYFKAQMERAEPKTAKEAEDLQKAKEIFEKLYREELDYLEGENKLLKECNIRNYTSRSNTDDMNLKLLEENKRLKEKLSEVTMIADDEKQSIEHILELEEENKRLKEVYDACNLDSINKSFKVANLEMENEKLKKELEFYKKQYEHSMGED